MVTEPDRVNGRNVNVATMALGRICRHITAISDTPKALGVSDIAVMWRHILPNAMVATLTFLPFTLSGSVTILASLAFLGFGLPLGSPSLGELVSQGKNNLQAPWLGTAAFVVLGGLLTLLVFIGEAVRDAFDPRKAPRIGRPR